MGFLHVGQDGLKLLGSRHPPASASQTARITGVSYHAWLGKHSGKLFCLFVYFVCFFPDRASLCHPSRSAVVRSWLTAASASWGSSKSCASAYWVDGITGSCHHAQLIFVFLVETGICYVDQVGLKLLISGDLPASASQSVGITGLSHYTRPSLLIF